MNPSEFIQLYRARLDNLRSNRGEDVLTIAADLTAVVQLRIQSSGEDFQGSQYPGYTPNYAKYGRRALGYQAEYVDFTRTGRMWANIQPYLLNETESSVEVEITARDQDSQDKLRGQVDKRGNILRPSDDELQEVAEANRERIRKRLGI